MLSVIQDAAGGERASSWALLLPLPAPEHGSSAGKWVFSRRIWWCFKINNEVLLKMYFSYPALELEEQSLGAVSRGCIAGDGERQPGWVCWCWLGGRHRAVGLGRFCSPSCASLSASKPRSGSGECSSGAVSPPALLAATLSQLRNMGGVWAV